MGADVVPITKHIVPSETTFSMSDATAAKDVAFWRLSLRELEYLQANGLQEAGRLVLQEGLSDFSTAVRSSLIVYGKGTTFPDPIDRLTHTLSALEGVLLKHQLEPVQANVADRMSFLLAKSHVEREGVSQVVRQAYRLREWPRLKAFTRREDELLMTFVAQAKFIDGVDELGAYVTVHTTFSA
jgi:hypothetical protein